MQRGKDLQVQGLAHPTGQAEMLSQKPTIFTVVFSFFLFSFLSFLGILLQANLALSSSGSVFISVQQGLETFVASFGLFPGEGGKETVLVLRSPDKKPALNEVKFLFQGNPKRLPSVQWCAEVLQGR